MHEYFFSPVTDGGLSARSDPLVMGLLTACGWVNHLGM